MPRSPRIVLPGFPHHVIQQGHNKEPVFLEEADYVFYLETLAELKQQFDCRVFSYALMTTHSHLTIDPGVVVENLARLMKRLGGRYTRYVNRRERTTGTAWNGRYRSSPIETETYFLACLRYSDLNPVRAGMVLRAGDYRWSSYRHWAGIDDIPWLDEHPIYTELGTSAEDRQEAYRRWVHAAVPRREWETIRLATARGHPIGNDRFRQEIERRLERRIEVRGPGRPRRKR